MINHVPTNECTVEPSEEPVSASDVKLNARIEFDNTIDEVLIKQLIPTARRFVENLAGRSLITQTRRQSYDYMPSSPVRLRYGPVQSISSYTYLDENQVSQTMAASYYTLESRRAGQPTLRLAYNQSWPAATSDTNSIAITYVAGYGDHPEAVPIIYRQAIILLCTHWYFNPDALGCEDASGIIDRLENLLSIEGRTVAYA